MVLLYNYTFNYKISSCITVCGSRFYIIFTYKYQRCIKTTLKSIKDRNMRKYHGKFISTQNKTKRNLYILCTKFRKNDTTYEVFLFFNITYLFWVKHEVI